MIATGGTLPGKPLSGVRRQAVRGAVKAAHLQLGQAVAANPLSTRDPRERGGGPVALVRSQAGVRSEEAAYPSAR
jgi:hypothetical protein